MSIKKNINVNDTFEVFELLSWQYDKLSNNSKMLSIAYESLSKQIKIELNVTEFMLEALRLDNSSICTNAIKLQISNNALLCKLTSDIISN